MKTHESEAYEKLAGRFHKLLGIVSMGVGAGMVLVGIATLAQAAWHLKAAKEHEAELPEFTAAEVEARIAKVREAVEQEPHPFPNIRESAHVFIPTKQDADGSLAIDADNCGKA